jgi:hypothetical protein
MKPSQISGTLKHIANKIDNSVNPVRALVAKDLRRVVMSMNEVLGTIKNPMEALVIEFKKHGYDAEVANHIQNLQEATEFDRDDYLLRFWKEECSEEEVDLYNLVLMADLGVTVEPPNSSGVTPTLGKISTQMTIQEAVNSMINIDVIRTEEALANE